MEVKRRKVRHMAQRLYRQVTVEMLINVGEHGVETLCVSDVDRRVRHWDKAPGSTVGNRVDYRGVNAPSRACSRHLLGWNVPWMTDCPFFTTATLPTERSSVRSTSP